MILILKRDWECPAVVDGEKTVRSIPAGRHEVKRISNPNGHENAPWLVLIDPTIAGVGKDDIIGSTEKLWRDWEDTAYGEYQVIVVY